MNATERIARVRELDTERFTTKDTLEYCDAKAELASHAPRLADALERALAELTRCREENDKLRAEVAALTADKERLEGVIRNVIDSAVEPSKAHYASMVPLAPLRESLAARQPKADQ